MHTTVAKADPEIARVIGIPASFNFHLRIFKNGVRFTWNEIGTFMGYCIGSTIRSEWQKGNRALKATGRPRVISEKAREVIQNMIVTGYSERKPVTYFEILDALRYLCRAVISSDA
jgi:hypothetical protein